MDSNAEDHVQGQVPGPGPDPIADPDTASDIDSDDTTIDDFAQEYTSLAGRRGIVKRLEPVHNEDLSRRSILRLAHRSDAKSGTSFSADGGLEEAFRGLVDKQNHVRADPWDDIPDWLMSDSGIYWVYGKPGSGKSRLMRYLARGEDMRRLVTAGWMRFIICHFSVDGKAWERHEQLHKWILWWLVLDGCHPIDYVLPLALPDMCAEAAIARYVDDIHLPSKDQLRRAFEVFGSAKGNGRCLFLIDGVDELAGE